jgi:pyruvate dehydrogenase E1 component alpha subunit
MLEKLKFQYKQMFLIRRFEEESARAYSMGKIGGFCHLYIGQEAIAVGSVSALRKSDHVVTTYRDHGLALAKGTSSRACMAELFGKSTGCSKGLGGSMHFFDVENNFLGGHGIIGAHIPLAAGVAFNTKYQNKDDVTLCFFGDGSASIGGFHEGISLAALWNLPIVFICENNMYSMGTPLERTMSVHDVSKKASGYGIYGEQHIVTSVEGVEDVISRAVELARTGKPSLIELRTYRFRGHSMSDPGKYRTPEELEKYKNEDPLVHCRNKLLTMISEQEIQKIEAEVNDEVNDAVKFAEESPEPDANLLEKTVYAGNFVY